jgi:hypothetical protein
MPKYVKICRIKFNCSNANAAIRGDYYFLSICIVRNKIRIYIKILALIITQYKNMSTEAEDIVGSHYQTTVNTRQTEKN